LCGSDRYTFGCRSYRCGANNWPTTIDITVRRNESCQHQYGCSAHLTWFAESNFTFIEYVRAHNGRKLWALFLCKNKEHGCKLASLSENSYFFFPRCNNTSLKCIFFVCVHSNPADGMHSRLVHNKNWIIFLLHGSTANTHNDERFPFYISSGVLEHGYFLDYHAGCILFFPGRESTYKILHSARDLVILTPYI